MYMGYVYFVTSKSLYPSTRLDYTLACIAENIEYLNKWSILYLLFTVTVASHLWLPCSPLLEWKKLLSENVILNSSFWTWLSSKGLGLGHSFVLKKCQTSEIYKVYIYLPVRLWLAGRCHVREYLHSSTTEI